MVDLAIIGGTGIGTKLAELGGKTRVVPTPKGLLRGKVIEYKKLKIFLAQRHSSGHKTPPHQINYPAIALGLKALGVKACFSTTAVGSVREDWPAGTIAACSDFIDLTSRQTTLYTNQVIHTDFTHPFDPVCRVSLLKSAAELGIPIHDKAVYVGMAGPRYETPEEVKMVRMLGGDVVGMTATSEAIAMQEAGIPYACLTVVTNLASGMDAPKLSHEDVVAMMNQSSQTAVHLLLAASLHVNTSKL